MASFSFIFYLSRLRGRDRGVERILEVEGLKRGLRGCQEEGGEGLQGKAEHEC